MKKGNRDEEEGPDEKVPDSKWFRHNSPVTQVILISLVCFCCSGMFNAISGLGGSGQENDQASNHANTALYATFSVFGIFAGGVYNILGPRRTIFAGCCTYALYAGSFLYYNHDHGETFPVIAVGILGVGAALFWAGQGSIITSYPTEDKKGRYISLFWVIYNLGGVVGGFIPFILNYHSKAASVTDGTYIAFMCFMVLGTFVSLALLPPDKVVRNDGSKPTLRKYSNVSTEGMEVLKLFFNWKMMLLFPAAWASKFFYTYEFNNVNGKIFTVRTRGLNNVSFWGAQMLGSVAIGYVLDFSFQNRKKRGFLGVAIVTILGTAIWGGGLANQLRYSRDKPLQEIDFKDSGSAFAGPFVLYFSYGLLDSMFQTLCYWIIGALADDSHTLSRYNGLFKAVQSAGTAVGWATDRQSVSLLEQLIINWSLVTISYPFLIILIVLAVDDGATATAIEPKSGFQDEGRAYTVSLAPQPPSVSMSLAV